MRRTGFLRWCALALSVSAGVAAAVAAPNAANPSGDLAKCLIPMAGAVPPLASCPDQSEPWSGVEHGPDPQWTARRAR